MDDRLGFELDINADTHSLPQSIQLLSQIDSKLGMIGKGLERFDQGTRKLNGATHGIRSMTMGFTELASALQLVERGLGAVTKLAGMASHGSSYAISAMGERSATIRAYTQLTGSKEQANLELYRAQSFAQKTDFTSEAIEKSQARLMAQGFRGQELYATLFAASDLAAIMPGNKNETLERVTMAMSQIRAKGKLQGEELTQQLAEAGLNTFLVKEQIKKSLGLKSTGEVDKLMGKGQITADIALPAIQRAILQQLGTSRAGEFATSSAGSVTALEANRAEAIKNVLKGFDADENLPAMDRYKKALTDQGRLFDINSKTGKDLSLVVQDLANASLEAKSAVNEFVTGFTESFSESYAKTLAKEGRNDIGSSIDQLDMLGRAIGRLGSVASMAVGRTDTLVGSLAGLLTDQIDAIAAVQKSSGLTYAKGLLESTPMGMIGRGIKSAQQAEYNWLFNKGGEGVDVYAEVRRKLREGESERAAFGEFTGAGMGGGKAPESPFAIKLKNEIRTKAKAEAKAAKEEYRGVFWDYQFSGSTGRWADAPTLGQLASGTHTTAAALTQISRAAEGNMPPVNIYISGYGKDQGALARQIATELGRVARQPH